ncbi:hypothetical protein AALO_G00224390 [Alosa alosa]|uniref:Uncharacterized protein n=1 Tax=Alosa alosa TaxID=278164 RepID=A0AAV6G0U1_9TELE|nr:uncharacterized protein LOC125311025 [Alosa alosa]KAG5267677.1 hypothetical protein AALO_G00224390 [Alosa alosa]
MTTMCKNIVIFALISVHIQFSRSLGDCTIYNFSICWLLKDTNATPTARPNISAWLNEAELMSIGKFGKFNSLTVQTSERHSLKLQYGDLARTWTFSVSDSLHTIELQSIDSAIEETPNEFSVDAFSVFSPEQFFACEKDPLYLHQSEDFILMLGHTTRFPLKLESHSSYMLLVSWRDTHDPTPPLPQTHHHSSVSIYHRELGAYTTLSVDTTDAQYYRFSSLQGCMPYVACHELPARPSVTCLSTITDPDVPRNFQVTSWNTSQVTVSWHCPRNNKFSLFLLTMLHLNGTDHVVEETVYRHTRQPLIFTASDLPPCSRVQFGLQTVCVSGIESRTSKTVMIDGNSAHSSIQSIRQSSAGPDTYTLSWSVMDASLIAVFKVYHQGALQASTFLTTHSVVGLVPCQHYAARVEAVCGESIVMNVKTLQTHTGPRVVSDLRYQAEDSIALWSSPSSPGGAFSYSLTLEDGSPVRSGRLREPLLSLGHLPPGLPYVLEVWEECHGWESPSRVVLCFDARKAPEVDVRQTDKALLMGNGDMTADDFMRSSLAMIVPWRLPPELEDPKSPPRLQLKRIVINKISELVKDFPHPESVDALTFEDYGNGTQTKIGFVMRKASVKEARVPSSSAEMLTFIRSHSQTGITVNDDIIYWDDPDECSMLELNQCTPHSVCINTLDSYTCVCQSGYYDISPFLSPTTACREKGLFTQCSQDFITGSVAKAHLVDYLGGNVTVVLNDGQCPVSESGTLYYFRASHHPSHCGTRIVVNRTHTEFMNVLTVTLSREMVITRRDLKVVWKCIYPTSYLHNTEMNVHLEWVPSYTLVESNSSHILEVVMALYKDDSFTDNYTNAVTLYPDDFLYLEVILNAHNTFASDLLLEVVTCWATESSNPLDKTQGILLRDGCPVDRTFMWLSENGMAQMTRFSVQMFSMPAGLPFYIHCLTRVCAPDENCTTTCPAKMSSKVRRDLRQTPSTVVSAGPLLVGNISSTRSTHSKWKEVAMLVTILGGSIGFLVLTLLVVTAVKTLLNHSGRVQ